MYICFYMYVFFTYTTFVHTCQVSVFILEVGVPSQRNWLLRLSPKYSVFCTIWHLGYKLGVYRWPQCNFKKRFYKYHSRLSKITSGNRCRIDGRGNAGKSRGQSPRYFCHVIKSPDWLTSRMRKTPSFWSHLLPIIFSLKEEIVLIFPMKMHCLVSKVSIKYKNTMFLQHMKSFKPFKGGNISSFSKFQPECWWTK